MERQPRHRRTGRAGDPTLKREPGQDIVAFGGGHFAHSLIRARLVDEYPLTVHPAALGDGISLMHGLPEPQRFELISSTASTASSVAKIEQLAVRSLGNMSGQ